MIAINHLIKSFGRFRAVDDVTFDVRAGEAVALWGPNGAGKTTIIRCVLGLLRFEGGITVTDFDARRQGKAARRAIGYVPQELAFYDDLHVIEALRLFARLKKAPLARIDTVLAEVGLLEEDRKRVRELSGGMKQRLALASALLADPPILVLDELTSNLDASAQSAFMDLLLDLKRRGKTILFTSHHFDEVLALADRVLVMECGRILRYCAPHEADPRGKTGQVLRLIIEAPALDRAVAALATRGFEVQRNGCSVTVPVSNGRKGLAIQALHAADILISDFELASDMSLLRNGGSRHE